MSFQSEGCLVAQLQNPWGSQRPAEQRPATSLERQEFADASQLKCPYSEGAKKCHLAALKSGSIAMQDCNEWFEFGDESTVVVFSRSTGFPV